MRPLRVSDNRRFLVDHEGHPFFWLGDTAWELFHRTTREEALRYLDDRAAKGFTVIQAVALAEMDGLRVPNSYGHLPLEGEDPLRPVEAYWEHVDFVVREANRRGLFVGFLPTWGDKWNRKWGGGPEVFTPDNAEAYGEWVGRRYREADVIWVLGGDRPVETDEHREIIRRMALGLHKGDGGVHLHTFHPMGGSGSAEVFHDAPWLDFNMRQNGHAADFTGRYNLTTTDYAREPVKPVLDGEPIYEGHPIEFSAEKHGYSTAADVRRPLYWDLFQGAFGHTYGHHSVWQFYDQGREPVNRPLMTWKEAIAEPGAGQMRHGRALMESRPFLSRVPDPSILVPDTHGVLVPGAGRYAYVATRDVDGTYAMVYAPHGRPFLVRLDVIRGAQVRAWWFSPRDGSALEIGVVAARGSHLFAPPTPGEALDWVLVLDDVAAAYGPPGSR